MSTDMIVTDGFTPELLLTQDDSSPAFQELEELTPEEEIKRTKLEEQAREAVEAFYQFYAAIADIKELKLYRSTHRSFSEYLKDVWNRTPGRFYQVQQLTRMRASIAALLPDSAECPLPDNERQIRCLAKRTPQEQADIWRLAVDQYGDSPTGQEVELAAVNFDFDQAVEIEGAGENQESKSIPGIRFDQDFPESSERDRLLAGIPPEIRDTVWSVASRLSPGMPVSEANIATAWETIRDVEEAKRGVNGPNSYSEIKKELQGSKSAKSANGTGAAKKPFKNGQIIGIDSGARERAGSAVGEAVRRISDCGILDAELVDKEGKAHGLTIADALGIMRVMLGFDFGTSNKKQSA